MSFKTLLKQCLLPRVKISLTSPGKVHGLFFWCCFYHAYYSIIVFVMVTYLNNYLPYWTVGGTMSCSYFFCIMGIIYTVSYSFPLTQCKCSWFCRTILFPKCERILNVAHKYLLHVICKELQGLAAKANKVSNLGISVAVA